MSLSWSPAASSPNAVADCGGAAVMDSPHESTRPDGAKRWIAGLSDAQISQMTRSDLVEVIRQSQVPLASGVSHSQLQMRDASELRQLVFLTRRCCRNQVESSLRY